jgi:hypothetical protein
MNEKTAQTRSKWNRLREKFDPIGKTKEYYSPELAEILEMMREVDESVRNIALGNGEGDPVAGKTFKDLLRVAETNLKRREYMAAISYVGRFHERMQAINAELAKLDIKVDALHHRFLFQDVDPESEKYLTNTLAPMFEKYRRRPPLQYVEPPKKKKATLEVELVVEGGISDWWANITTERGKSLAAWEKRFPKYSREIKAQTTAMISRSNGLLDNLLTTLKRLDSFRAARKLEEYMQTAKKWRDRYRAYDTAFIAFYNSQVRRFIDFQKDMDSNKENAEDKKGDQIAQHPSGVPQPGNWNEISGAALKPLGGNDPLPSWKELPLDFMRAYARNTITKGNGWDVMVKKRPEWAHKAFNMIVRELELAKERRSAPTSVARPKQQISAVPPVSQAPVAPPTQQLEPPFSPPPVVAPSVIPAVAPASAASQPVPPNTAITPEMLAEIARLKAENEALATGKKVKRKKKSHDEFLASLTSVPEDTFAQALHILGYASKIEDDAPEDCEKLRKLATALLRS